MDFLAVQNSMAAATSIAVHASSSGLDNSRQQNHNGIAIVDETKEERRQWIAKVKDQVKHEHGGWTAF